jgi:hypothetical protein
LNESAASSSCFSICFLLTSDFLNSSSNDYRKSLFTFLSDVTLELLEDVAEDDSFSPRDIDEFLQLVGFSK